MAIDNGKDRSTSSEQATYLLAKAYHDTLQAQVEDALKGMPLETDEDIDVYCEKESEVRTELGMLQAEAMLREAEEALLAWGHAVAKQDRCYRANQEDIEKLFSTRHIVYRQKVLDLCLKLDARTIR